MVRKQFFVGFYFLSELTIVVSIVVSSVACVGGLKEPLTYVVINPKPINHLLT
jgi:hypothetical protein